jgi:hypothetical protein
VKHLNYLTSSIIRNCPNIQELVLTPNLLVIETHCPPAFYRLISGCMQLRNVSISGASALPVAIVKHLRGLPNLMSLMGMGIKTLSDIDLFTTEDGGFSNLHTFGFISQSWTISASMIESMDCPFKFLRVICRLSREPPTALSMFTNVLNRHRSASSLTVLVLCGIVHADQQTASEVLRPLFSLRALRDIALIFSFIHVLGDDWLEEAALSWPSLRYLSLALRERTSVEVLRLKIPQMTLAGLLPLIKYCPHLHHICLSLDATQIRPSPLLGVSNPIIDKLWLCSSPIITPEKVFRALVTMFPRLKKVVVYGAVEEDGWSKVNDLLNISAFDIAEESS